MDDAVIEREETDFADNLNFFTTITAAVRRVCHRILLRESLKHIEKTPS
jgi:hypothetical protein